MPQDRFRRAPPAAFPRREGLWLLQMNGGRLRRSSASVHRGRELPSLVYALSYSSANAKSRNPLTPSTKKQTHLNKTTKTPSCPRFYGTSQDSPALSAPRHPISLVSVIATEVVHLRNPVDVHCMFHQRGGKNGAYRQVRKPAVIGQFVNQRILVVHHPELGGCWFSIDRKDSQPQRASPRTRADQFRNELRVGFFLLPAGTVDFIVRLDRWLQAVIAGNDLNF